jgi:hypothetical protein
VEGGTLGGSVGCGVVGGGTTGGKTGGSVGCKDGGGIVSVVGKDDGCDDGGMLGAALGKLSRDRRYDDQYASFSDFQVGSAANMRPSASPGSSSERQTATVTDAKMKRNLMRLS